MTPTAPAAPAASDIETSAPRTARRVTRLAIAGMTCAACSARVEKVLARTPGVTRATVNLPLETALIETDGSLSVTDLVRRVEATGFTARETASSWQGEHERQQAAEAAALRAEKATLYLLIAAAIATAPMVVGMAAQPFGRDWMPPALVQAALAGFVQIFVGARFYAGALRALRAGGANMDVLVVLGTTAAFAYSLYLTANAWPADPGHLYFEASAVILTLILVGKLLEARAKRATTAAIRALSDLRPLTAHRVVGETTETVAVDALFPGDRVLVKPGERLPVDGTVVEGTSDLDESLLTGESMPVAKSVGDAVIGGTINGAGALMVEATALGADSRLAAIIRLVETAQAGKAPVQKLVDRVSAVFVPVVVAIAGLTALGWWLMGADADTILATSVAVLVIACPCALGLATPTALVAGTGAAARAGILIRDIDTLERAHGIDTAVFDKTGTLTEGAPQVTDIRAFDRNDDRLLRIAASVQLPSEHPLARAMVSAAEARGLALTRPSAFTAVPGQGIVAEIAGETVLIGNARMMQAQGIDGFLAGQIAREFEAAGKTCATVAVAGRAVGVIAMADAVRAESAQALKRLAEAGVESVMLTGDTDAVAKAIARQIGLTRVIAGVPPEGKAETVAALAGEGRCVAMIGDGVNDAPALAAADVGIAMGSGADVAMETAGITLMRPRPDLVADAILVSRATVRKIRQNLFWAFVYNVIGIPLAALGLLTPAFAGAAMALSSVSVVTNAALLRRWKAAAR